MHATMFSDYSTNKKKNIEKAEPYMLRFNNKPFFTSFSTKHKSIHMNKLSLKTPALIKKKQTRNEALQVTINPNKTERH